MTENIENIIKLVASFVSILGFIFGIIYFIIYAFKKRGNKEDALKDISEKLPDWIKEAEVIYSKFAPMKTGSQKFEWVMNVVKSLLPKDKFKASKKQIGKEINEIVAEMNENEAKLKASGIVETRKPLTWDK
ncbi:hypothetical protein [Metamycoplasma gateae]|uniref:Uncharacterized protein n=1 Tax=Metamycoplasma gateae TaxID=35769 RepID=A0ABZ2AHL3_9BACT|nr:hypothetical protein V2E26_02585 [Metamycoplasma gateae]